MFGNSGFSQKLTQRTRRNKEHKEEEKKGFCPLFYRESYRLAFGQKSPFPSL